MKKDRKLSTGIIVLSLFLTLVFGARAYWKWLQSPVNPNGQGKFFVIQRGENIDSIARRLEQEGLIRSAFVFKLTIKNSGKQIEAGNFKPSPRMSVREIIENLSHGAVDIWVTLIEGLRVEEYAKTLSEKLEVKSEKFIEAGKKHEGYLFPDTYLFNKDATAENIISITKDNFDKKYGLEIQAKVKSHGLTPQQGVILASIVEREARTKEARRMVASILLKRFKIGMGLNADATIQYALGYQGDEKSWWKRHLSKDDLKVQSSYNTYLHPGLPPTPICNPSLMSLEAVANADPTTEYLYYYHDSKGNAYYAKSLEDHNENVANYP